jgi:hypothetical protein
MVQQAVAALICTAHLRLSAISVSLRRQDNAQEDLSGAAARSTPDTDTAPSEQAAGWDDDRIVLPDSIKAPVMIRRRTLLEQAAAADQLPRALAARAARQ